MKNVDTGYWLSPDGELIESPEQEHAHSIAKIFHVPFVEDKSILYYRIAFENNYIRLIRTNKDELNIQLTKPATRKQKEIICDFFDTSKRTFVIYNWYESEIISRHELNKILSGNVKASLVKIDVPA